MKKTANTRFAARPLTLACAAALVAVLPLSAKLSAEAEPLYRHLSKKWMCEYDDRQSIGKRYRRQDEVGTPFCVTVDYQTKEDNTVTIRFRDSMEQIRVKREDLIPELFKAIKSYKFVRNY